MDPIFTEGCKSKTEWEKPVIHNKTTSKIGITNTESVQWKQE